MRTFAVLILLASAVPAERQLVTFRLKSDPRAPVRGWIVDFNETSFRLQRFGGRRSRVNWDALVDEDRLTLRRKVGLELSEREKKGLVRGHRLHFKAGGSIDGLLVRIDEDKRHWVKREGALIPYPGDQVVRVEETDVKDGDVFSPEEIYQRRFERIPPKTSRQHREFAQHMERVGNLERAVHHYKQAMIGDPSQRGDIEPRIADIEALMADKLAAALVRAARRSASLDKDFDRARRKVEQFIVENPDRRRQGQEMLDDIARQQHEEQGRRFLAVKHEEFDRMIDRYVLRKTSLAEAQQWIRSAVAKAVKERTMKRLGLTEEQWREFMAADSKSAPHWASYGAGSFAVSKRAKIGKGSNKVVRGDPERWWEGNTDAGTRASHLKAYAAERLPRLFTVIQVRHADCTMCGGKGATKHSSVNPLANGKHDFRVLCRRCYGAKHDRSVAYR